MEFSGLRTLYTLNSRVCDVVVEENESEVYRILKMKQAGMSEYVRMREI
jgi:hypothetical protein